MTGSARTESVPRTSPRSSTRESSRTTGLLYGICAYGLWGVAPLYIKTLAPAGTVEIVADRVVFSLAVCLVVITTKRSWPTLAGVFRSGRTFRALTLAAVLSSAFTLTYFYGVTAGQTIDVALGSFISPIVSVLLGVLVLKERLRPLQWSAVGIGAIAVVMLAVTNGVIPWIALTLAFIWGFYGLVKNRVGGSLDALAGLTVETIIQTPFAIAVMGWLAGAGTLTLTRSGAGHFWLLAAGGLLVVPMILFGASARRLPLSALGLLQYVSPVLVFILAVTVFSEHMGPERWAGFGMVWVALAILIVDMLLATRRRRGAPYAPGPLAAEYI